MRAANGESALTLNELQAKEIIRYIAFHEGLKDKYQSFTQADLTQLRAAGYEGPFLTVEEGVTRYVNWLLASA